MIHSASLINDLKMSMNAAQKYHLTARQAGMLARQAGAKRMVLFHFSPKYKKAPDVLNQEAMHAFQGDS